LLFYLFIIFLITGNSSLIGQENSLNQKWVLTGFYYPNGQVSSEGNMVDGNRMDSGKLIMLAEY